jgi:hypothetical protein
VAAAHEVAVSPQDRLWGDAQMELPQPGARQPVEDRSKESAVRCGDARSVDLPLQDRNWWRNDVEVDHI